MSSETVPWPTELFADLDRSGPVPLYFQVSQRLERAISTGLFPPGSRLENEISISERLSLSRPTIRRAIQELVDKGMLVRRRGIGTQVVHGQVSRPLELTSLFEDLEHTRREPTTEALTHEVIPAEAAVAELLGLAAGTKVLHIRRLRRTDGTPIAILENFLPLAHADISSDALESAGLYQVLRARGVSIRVANQSIGARRAAAEEAELLDVAKGSPVLTMDRTAYDDSGNAVEVGRHCYRPDLYHFETRLVAR